MESSNIVNRVKLDLSSSIFVLFATIFIAASVFSYAFIDLGIYLFFVFGLISTKNSILFFLYCSIINILNREIFEVPSLSILPFLYLFISLVFLLRTPNFKKNIILKNYHLIFILFGLYVLIHSIFISQIPSLSVIKSIFFFVTSLSLILMFNTIAKSHFIDVIRAISILILIVLFSSLIFLTSDDAYYVNGTGFQGITNHPQIFGLFTAVSFIYLMYIALSSNFKINTAVIMLMSSICIFLAYLSQARTSLFSIILTIVTSSLLVGLFNRRYRPLSIGLLSFFMISSYFLINAYFEEILQFLVKGAGSLDISEIAVESRGQLFFAMLENIRNNPITGIGFGVPSSMLLQDMSSVRTFAGFIISFPVEKGILYAAVFEELGIIGFSLFLFFLFSLMSYIINNNALGLMPIICVLFLNLSESTFFSFGSIGLLLFILFASSLRKIS